MEHDTSRSARWTAIVGAWIVMIGVAGGTLAATSAVQARMQPDVPADHRKPIVTDPTADGRSSGTTVPVRTGGDAMRAATLGEEFATEPGTCLAAEPTVHRDGNAGGYRPVPCSAAHDTEVVAHIATTTTDPIDRCTAVVVALDIDVPDDPAADPVFVGGVDVGDGTTVCTVTTSTRHGSLTRP